MLLCVRDHVDASPEEQGPSPERHDAAPMAVFSLRRCEVDFFTGLHEDFEDAARARHDDQPSWIRGLGRLDR
jgi:hypothetical protein